jgi:hypothetical protein
MNTGFTRGYEKYTILVLYFRYKVKVYDDNFHLRAVVIIREIGIISGLETVGITDVVSPSGLPRYHRYHCDTQVIPNFLDFKNWYHRWAGITTPYHVFYIEYNNYHRSAEYYECAQHNFDSRMHVRVHIIRNVLREST